MTTQFLTDENGRTVVAIIGSCEAALSCGGKPLTLLMPNTSEGASEKHLPVVERDGERLTAKVGSVFHPMSEDHSIGWVYLETAKGGQLHRLCPDEEPVAEFRLAPDDDPVAVYAYCNLHGLWKTEL